MIVRKRLVDFVRQGQAAYKVLRERKGIELEDLFHETGLDVDMLPEIEALGYATKDPEEFERVYDELEDWRYTRRTEVTFPTYVEA